jgi:hypothetical protein
VSFAAGALDRNSSLADQTKHKPPVTVEAIPPRGTCVKNSADKNKTKTTREGTSN